jgi:hypothetical protein
MRLFGTPVGRALGLGVSMVVAAGMAAVEPAAAGAALWAVKKAPAKKAAPRKKAAPNRKQVVGLDLPPLPKGRSCYRAGSEVPEPPVLKTAEIKVSSQERGGALKSALLVYEVTVDTSGRISEVRTVGERPKEPPWPQLHESAIATLKQYKYAKTIVRGASAPVCLMVSLNVDLR